MKNLLLALAVVVGTALVANTASAAHKHNHRKHSHKKHSHKKHSHYKVYKVYPQNYYYIKRSHGCNTYPTYGYNYYNGGSFYYSGKKVSLGFSW